MNTDPVLLALPAEHHVPFASSQSPEPTARQLLLNLLLVAEHGRLDAADAVRACALFGFSANNARVALNRLVASGLAEMVGRGSYKLGHDARVLGEDVASWRRAEQAVQPWRGGWVMALTAGLGRVDRTALKARERALALLGMQQLDNEVYIRPDNLAGGVDRIRSRLYTLGLESSASVFLAHGFDAERDSRAAQLWNVKELIKTYRNGRHMLEKSLTKLERLPLEVAAKEAYATGNHAIRQLVFDPMLPEPLIDVDARRSFREAVLNYEDVGRGLWRKFYASASS